MRHTPVVPFSPLAERKPARARQAKSVAARKADLAMLPLYGLVITGAAALASLGAPSLGAWPLLTVLACPLLHLVMRGE